MKLVSWNVEHFTGKAQGDREGRLERVVDAIRQQDPDVFALIEVEGRRVFTTLVSAFPGYTFHITQGRQTQEILIGVRGGTTAFFTQKTEFKRSNPSLRPGALLTVTNRHNVSLPILFVHLKSLSTPEGFGLRDEMFKKVRELKRALDKAAGGRSEFILIGDMNTMGMNLTYSNKDISSTEEIQRIQQILGRVGLRNLPKSHHLTYHEGSDGSYPPDDLDHVFATEGLTFQDQGSGAHVLVGGWALQPNVAARDTWINEFSDHAPLILDVNGW